MILIDSFDDTLQILKEKLTENYDFFSEQRQLQSSRIWGILEFRGCDDIFYISF